MVLASARMTAQYAPFPGVSMNPSAPCTLQPRRSRCRAPTGHALTIGCPSAMARAGAVIRGVPTKAPSNHSATCPTVRHSSTTALKPSPVAVKYWAPWSNCRSSIRRVAIRPPTPRLFSNNVTSAPDRFSRRAAAKPAIPAPITAIRRDIVSRPVHNSNRALPGKRTTRHFALVPLGPQLGDYLGMIIALSQFMRIGRPSGVFSGIIRSAA